MQSFVWKPGLSVAAASLGNKGIIEARNQFDVLEVSEGGWEYQSYELAEATKATAQSGKVCTMRLFGLLCSWHLFFVVSTWADFGIGC